MRDPDDQADGSGAAISVLVPIDPAPGEIDMTNARQLRQRLYTALATGAPVVVADMTASGFCDSIGRGTLVMAHKRATAVTKVTQTVAKVRTSYRLLSGSLQPVARQERSDRIVATRDTRSEAERSRREFPGAILALSAQRERGYT